jgi:Mrp family chromosome partitioning ATPase/capsular polysaccharide biosynthesis protein
MPTISEVTEADQGTVLRVAKRWSGLIILTAVLFAIIGAAAGYSQRTHTATAQVALANPLALSGSASSISSSQAAQTVANETQYLESNPVKLAAQKSLGNSSATVTFATVTGSNIVDVTASAKSATTAADIANAFANAYVAIRTSDIDQEIKAAQAQIQSQIDAVTAQIKPLDATLAAAGSANAAQLQLITTQVGPQRTALLNQQQTLQTQLNGLSDSRILNNADPNVVAPATANKSSGLSGLLVYAFGGLLLGLLVGLGLALLLDRRYGKVRKESDVFVKGAEIPFVAAVAPTSHARGATPSPADVTRTYRRVAGELMHRGTAAAGATYMVAAIGSTVRSSEASTGLAQSVAAMGWTVSLIDADLDGPALEREFGVDLQPGLAELLDEETVDPATVAFPKVGPDGGVTLVPAGTATDTSRIRLLGPRLPSVVESFAERSRMVLLRTPSQDSVGTAVLSSIADAVVVVGVVGRTRRRELEDAVKEFGVAGLPIAGVLLLSPERPPGNGPVGAALPADQPALNA